MLGCLPIIESFLHLYIRLRAFKMIPRNFFKVVWYFLQPIVCAENLVKSRWSDVIVVSWHYAAGVLLLFYLVHQLAGYVLYCQPSTQQMDLLSRSHDPVSSVMYWIIWDLASVMKDVRLRRNSTSWAIVGLQLCHWKGCPVTRRDIYQPPVSEQCEIPCCSHLLKNETQCIYMVGRCW